MGYSHTRPDLVDPWVTMICPKPECKAWYPVGAKHECSDPVAMKMHRLALRSIYEAERKRDERTFARDHGFDEWLNH